jgi:hypothetical protein
MQLWEGFWKNLLLNYYTKVTDIDLFFYWDLYTETIQASLIFVSASYIMPHFLKIQTEELEN